MSVLPHVFDPFFVFFVTGFIFVTGFFSLPTLQKCPTVSIVVDPRFFFVTGFFSLPDYFFILPFDLKKSPRADESTQPPNNRSLLNGHLNPYTLGVMRVMSSIIY